VVAAVAGVTWDEVCLAASNQLLMAVRSAGMATLDAFAGPTLSWPKSPVLTGLPGPTAGTLASNSAAGCRWCQQRIWAGPSSPAPGARSTGQPAPCSSHRRDRAAIRQRQGFRLSRGAPLGPALVPRLICGPARGLAEAAW